MLNFQTGLVGNNQGKKAIVTMFWDASFAFVSLTYLPLKKRVNAIDGVISLNLNYGEITEEIVQELISKFRVRYVFSGSAGGFIPKNGSEERPEIGSYIPIKKSKNFAGNIEELPAPVSLNSAGISENKRMHLQAPSIFVETFDWLDSNREIGSSVGVETYYFIKAINQHNKRHPDDLAYGYIGYFVSDYVGEKPLREYSKVFSRYEIVLDEFLDIAFKKAKIQ